MGDRIIKLLGSEIKPLRESGNATNVPGLDGTGAKLVRALNTDNTDQLLITLTTESLGEVIGTIDLDTKKEMFIEKNPTDEIWYTGSSSGMLLLVSVASA